VGTAVYHGEWAPWVRAYSSGYKELLPILFALTILAPLHQGQVIVFTTDNLGNAFAINKGSCRSADSFPILFRIFEIAAAHNLYLIADWVPREFNEFTDYVSKIVNTCEGNIIS